MQNDYQRVDVDVMGVIKEAWELYKAQAALLTIAFVVLAILQGFAAIIPFASGLLTGPLLVGFYSMVKKIDHDEAVDIKNLFDGFSKFVPLVLATIVVSLLVTIGVILFLLPGLYLAIAYGFTYFFIWERDMDFWPAMEASRKLITANFWNYLLYILVLVAINVIASIPAGLGLFISVPVSLAAQYVMFKKLAG